LQEAYRPKKKGEVNQIKTPSLEVPSLAGTAHHLNIAAACKCDKFALGKKGQPQRT